MHRFVSLMAVLAIAALPASSQGRGPGQAPPIPDHWVAFDSLVQAIGLTDDQRGTVQPLHAQIDSLVRHGATLRAEARDEMQRTRDRQVMQRYFQRLQSMQQRADRLLTDLKAGLSAEQKTALDALRAPMVMPRGQRRE